MFMDGKINIVKVSTLPKSKCNPYQDSNGIFLKVENTILKFIWNHKTLNSQSNPEKEE